MAKGRDRNSSSFFFKSISKNRSRNRLVSITRVDGSIVNSEEEVKQEAINFFQSLLVCSVGEDSSRRDGLNRLVSNPLDYVLTDSLCANFTPDDNKSVCFSMHPNKSLGLDGHLLKSKSSGDKMSQPSVQKKCRASVNQVHPMK
ncbi:hypothetical protein ACFX19_041126 [Malus domestica]